MKLTIAASAALTLTCALGYAQVPQQTDMQGARHRLVFGKDKRAPLAYPTQAESALMIELYRA